MREDQRESEQNPGPEGTGKFFLSKKRKYLPEASAMVPSEGGVVRSSSGVNSFEICFRSEYFGFHQTLGNDEECKRTKKWGPLINWVAMTVLVKLERSNSCFRKLKKKKICMCWIHGVEILCSIILHFTGIFETVGHRAHLVGTVPSVKMSIGSLRLIEWIVFLKATMLSRWEWMSSLVEEDVSKHWIFSIVVSTSSIQKTN